MNELILGRKVTGKKNYAVKVRVSREEFEKLQRKAEELGLRLSQYMRMVSLCAKIEDGIRSPK